MFEQLLYQEIQEKGPLSQSRFMELMLSHPIFGYYRNNEAIGIDFTTAPEISQVFGELIGAWMLDYYEKLNLPQKLSLIELGPGKGTLMKDLLRVVKILPSFLQDLDIHMVETNSLLKTLQKKAIPYPLNFVNKFIGIPECTNPIFIIANEFFDVLPTNCYERKNNILYERCIDYKENRLLFTLLERSQDRGPDQVWEECPEAENLMKEIASRLAKQAGIFLCIDYGYEQGNGESLQAIFKKQPSHPLAHLGKSDLTCHVNFACLKRIAQSYGLGVLGPLSQGEFLKNIGMDVRIGILKHKNPLERGNIELSAMRLTHPQHMGTLFKVMAVFSPSNINPIGFEI